MTSSRAAIGVPCVVGTSMALTRHALDAIGGFERFRRVLAEDQAIALAVKAAGYEVVLSPVVVRNVVVHRSLRRAVDRQIRWNKIRYSFSHRLYACEISVEHRGETRNISCVWSRVCAGFRSRN